MTEAEKEELAVQKRRSEGTPCTLENFMKWKADFVREQAAAVAAEKENASASNKKKDGKKEVDKTGRMTGYEHFSGKATNLEALEAAALQAENDEMEGEEGDIDVDEELFEEDVDLDDLDFDEDDDAEDDEEEELDI